MQREGKAEVRDDSGWFPGKTVDFFFTRNRKCRNGEAVSSVLHMLYLRQEQICQVELPREGIWNSSQVEELDVVKWSRQLELGPKSG